jgi:potassium channel subfamily K
MPEFKHDGVEAGKHSSQLMALWHRFNAVPMPKIREVARYCPLIAAILAPLSTLLDIPALTQRWYALNGVLQEDPKVSIALSAIGLALNVLANSLLLYRFTAHSIRNNSIATRVSLLAWLGKTIVAAVNLIVFGIMTRNDPGYSYREGFWCAVVSIIDSGIIVAVLSIHYMYFFRQKAEADIDVRLQGKQFLLSVTIFITILAIQALVFCKIEGWTYLDAIYFSVQTALTIGYGDFTPTQTSGKILVFVFSVLTISQLGNEIAVIVDFFSARAEERRDMWRQQYEGMMHKEANKEHPDAGLLEEMALIHQINTRQDL